MSWERTVTAVSRENILLKRHVFMGVFFNKHVSFSMDVIKLTEKSDIFDFHVVGHKSANLSFMIFSFVSDLGV